MLTANVFNGSVLEFREFWAADCCVRSPSHAPKSLKFASLVVCSGSVGVRKSLFSARASVTIYSETSRLDLSHKSDSGTSAKFAAG